jgi:hypothetical protein
LSISVLRILRSPNPSSHYCLFIIAPLAYLSIYHRALPLILCTLPPAIDLLASSVSFPPSSILLLRGQGHDQISSRAACSFALLPSFFVRKVPSAGAI